MVANVNDVAAYIVQREGRISTMKLQKLCYFAQGWSLVWADKPLFDEPIEAWRYGPVIPELYHQHRRKTAVDSWKGESKNLTREQQLIVDAMIEHYSAMSGFEMGALSHDHDCWDKAYNHVGPFMKGVTEITQDSIRDTFTAIAAS